MTRREELREEMLLAISKLMDFAEEKIKNFSDKDLEREAHLMGIDLLHDACHTLRGRLPKTEKHAEAR